MLDAQTAILQEAPISGLTIFPRADTNVNTRWPDKAVRNIIVNLWCSLTQIAPRGWVIQKTMLVGALG